GVSELFPVSSLGHTVLIPALLRWHVDEGSDAFLAFVVVLHLGTALALVAYYAADWLAIVRGLAASIVRGRIGDDPSEKTGWLLVAGTIPVGILGVLFESAVKKLFASPEPVAAFLFLNGLLMLGGETLRRRQHANAGHPYRRLPSLGAADGVLVGFAQDLALRLGDRRRAAPRSAARGCGALRVPARDPGDPGRERAGVSEAVRAGRARRARRSGGGRSARGYHRLRVGRLSHALVPAQRPRSVRVVLHARRRRLVRSLRHESHRMKPLALILAVVFIIIAILYWVGHTPLGQHTKHGILFFVLFLLCLVWYRFQSAQPAR